MGLRNNLPNQENLLIGMIEFTEHAVKPFLSLAGKQLRRGGPGSNELMRLSLDTLKALNKMKDGLK